MKSQTMSRASSDGANKTTVARPFLSTGERLLAKEGATSLGAQSDEWLSTKEVARLTKLSTSTFEKARLPGRWNGLPWYKIGGRVLYRKSEVLAWMETFRIEGGARNA